MSEFLNDLEFEEHIKGMTNREIQEFNARQLYDVCKVVTLHGTRLENVEKKSNRIVGTAAAIGTGIGALIIAGINYFTGR